MTMLGNIFQLLSLAGGLCFLLFVGLYLRKERKERERLAQTRTDIADISILFQTMRDVISQQKKLAKDFNQELDKKLGLVKQILAQSMEKNERLFERQQQLVQELHESRSQVESVQRQLSEIREAIAGEEIAGRAAMRSPESDPGARRGSHYAVPEAPESPNYDDDAAGAYQAGAAQDAPQHALLEELPLNGAGIMSVDYEPWERMDFQSSEEEADTEHEAEPAEPTPANPEDGEAAREAFRALLDLNAPQTQRATSAPPSEEKGGNGLSVGAPLQNRVAEYAQAGMTVADIAHELGIGKGEVRLMLSLSKQSSRGFR